MPIRSSRGINLIVVAVAAYYFVKMFSSTRSALRAREMLRRGREITATTKLAYGSVT